MFRKILVFLTLCLLASAVLADAPANFTLNNLKDQPFTLESHLGHKPMVVAFFTSWSKSCQAELAFLKNLDEKYTDSQLKIIGVSFDRKKDELQTYLTTNKINFEVLYDKKMTTLKAYKITVIPTLYLIDQTGEVTKIFVDYDESVEKAVEAELKKLLK